MHLKSPILKEEGGVLDVNFHPDLKRIIKETKYLDQLMVAATHNTKIPETALSVTLQEEKYNKFIANISKMIRNYQSAVSKVGVAEKPLITRMLEDLKKVLNPGFEVLNWNSLGIPDFIAKCEQVI